MGRRMQSWERVVMLSGPGMRPKDRCAELGMPATAFATTPGNAASLLAHCDAMVGLSVEQRLRLLPDSVVARKGPHHKRTASTEPTIVGRSYAACWSLIVSS